MKQTLLISAIIAGSVGASQAAVTAANLVAHYDFDGNADNNAGPAPNGSLEDGAVISAAGGGYDGIGQALELGANNGRLTTTAGTHFNSLTSANKLAISFWQYDTVLGDGAISFKLVGTTADRGAQVHAPWRDGQIYYDTGGTGMPGNRLRINPGAPAIDQWNHWVFQKDGAAKPWVFGCFDIAQ